MPPDPRPPPPRCPLTAAARFLCIGAPRVLLALVQSGRKRVPADEKLDRGALSRPPLAVEQAQALSLDLVLTELVDAVVDQRGQGLFVQHRHLGSVTEISTELNPLNLGKLNSKNNDDW